MKSDDLTPEELDALREVSHRAMQKVIPNEVQDRLLEQKLIEQKLGGLALTAKGKIYIARHKGRL